MKQLLLRPLGPMSTEERHTYLLSVFKEVAVAPNDTYDAQAAPMGMDYLFHYLGAAVTGRIRPGEEIRRSVVEAACAHDPAMVDALWKADMNPMWAGGRRHVWEAEFPIATYSGFWRPEIIREIEDSTSEALRHREHSTLLVLPCSANKPYPSTLHAKVLPFFHGLPVDIAVVSTALGLTHQRRWGKMPRYDNGLPLFSRIIDVVPAYLSIAGYNRVINLADMLQHDLSEAVHRTSRRPDLIIPHARPAPGPLGVRDDYMSDLDTWGAVARRAVELCF